VASDKTGAHLREERPGKSAGVNSGWGTRHRLRACLRQQVCARQRTLRRSGVINTMGHPPDTSKSVDERPQKFAEGANLCATEMRRSVPER
jgi:hypothetical protein